MPQSIQLTREEYRHLVEQAPILIWRAGTDALCNYFNGRWLQFRGRTLEEEQGNGWAEGVHPDDFQRCLDTYLTAFGKREIFEMEYRLMRHDGVYRWLFDRGVPYYHDDGEFAGYIGSCVDVTGRIEAEEALRRAQEEEIDKLKGLLPICCNCKKIKDDQGCWHQVEVYIANRSSVDFTHGICPECTKQLYGEYL